MWLNGSLFYNMWVRAHTEAGLAYEIMKTLWSSITLLYTYCILLSQQMKHLEPMDPSGLNNSLLWQAAQKGYKDSYLKEEQEEQKHSKAHSCEASFYYLSADVLITDSALCSWSSKQFDSSYFRAVYMQKHTFSACFLMYFKWIMLPGSKMRSDI